MEKRYDHKTNDAQIRKLWNEAKTYKQNDPNKKNYRIDTPPPTISGSLHIGHIFSYTQTDIIARYKRMNGHNVFYPFGFDDNGLPTERFVEKKYKTNVGKIGREKFIELCLQTTKEMKEKFVELWQTIGLSANFENSYSTISKEVQKISQESFIRLYKDGHCYMKNESAIFCAKCRTTVAQAELDDVEQSTKFNIILFKTDDKKDLKIATTRPELLPSCVAILYHPDDERYKNLKGKKGITPVFKQKVPILEDDLVKIDKGTGLVMVCTFGDKTDIEWYKKHKLPYIEAIDFNGKLVESAGPLFGLKVPAAREKIIELLREEGSLITQSDLNHSVNVHERCKSNIEYIVLPQWFVNIIKQKDIFLKAADEINWYPTHMKSRFIDWVNNLSWDWCISRQRVYGIPFPVWYCNNCSEILTPEISELPIDPQISDLFKKCTKCGSENIRPEKDVMDTWNTSSLTPYICKELYKKDSNEKLSNTFEDDDFIPMGMRPQAHDIIRTWTFYTIVKTILHNKKTPWRDIVISGYVLSSQNEKISKSKGNAPTEPEQLLKLYAPDAIRFWAASGSLGADTAFSEDQIKIGQKLMNKIWNAFKFLNINLENYKEKEFKSGELNVINQWINDRTNIALKNYKSYFEKNESGLALQSVEKLFWQDLCDNYIEIIKDQFFNPEKYPAGMVEETKATFYSVAYKILQMYAPYIPHITEYLYQQIFLRNKNINSIHLTDLPETEPVDNENQAKMDMILNIISQVRKLKTEHELSLRTEIKNLKLAVDEKHKDMIKKQIEILKGVCKAENIEIVDDEAKTTLDKKNEQIFVLINLKA